MTLEDLQSKKEGVAAVNMDEYWNLGELIAGQIAREGLESYFSGNPSLTELFCGGQKCMYCMDDRMAQWADKESGLRVAACGLLLEEKERKSLIAYAKSRGIKKVTMHEGCGARALYARLNGLSPEEALVHERAWLEEFNAVLGGEHSVELLPVTPANVHNARMALVDFTGRFVLTGSAARQLPASFVVTAPAVPVGHVLAQVDVAVQIALGDHGFGNRFTSESPFIIGVLADDASSLGFCDLPELTALAAAHGGRVRIDRVLV